MPTLDHAVSLEELSGWPTTASNRYPELTLIERACVLDEQCVSTRSAVAELNISLSSHTVTNPRPAVF